MKVPLKDRNSTIIGYIDTDSSGRQTLMDRNSTILGYYNPIANTTLDRNHNIVGYGNILISLLK
jgi:hypothetical protein